MFPRKTSVQSVRDNLKEKTTEQDEEQTLHRRFADQCRAVKKKYKAMATLDPSIVAATFDLQSILQLPCSDASPLYYKRKRVLYNLTVHEAVSLGGHCYVWNETNGLKVPTKSVQHYTII